LRHLKTMSNLGFHLQKIITHLQVSHAGGVKERFKQGSFSVQKFSI